MSTKSRRSKARSGARKSPTVVPGPRPWVDAFRNVPLFPARSRQTHQLYYDWGRSATAVAGNAANRIYTCNGLFDPDISGGGHQPMGFDQMMLLYNQYTVLRSKISVTFVGDQALRVGVYLNPDTTAINDPIAIVENGLIKTSTVDASGLNAGTGQRITTVELSFDTAKYFGRPNDESVLNDASLRGGASSNPTEQAYFFIVAWACFAQATAPQVIFDVLISYDVVYWEPRKLSSS